MGLEPCDKNPTDFSTTMGLNRTGGAESGAVVNRSAEITPNNDVLAAFAAVLTPEQRAALAKLLGGLPPG